MRLIANSMLQANHRDTYVQGEVLHEKVALPRPSVQQGGYHLYVSEHNPGALLILEEYAVSQSLTVSLSRSGSVSGSGRKALAQLARLGQSFSHKSHSPTRNAVGSSATPRRRRFSRQPSANAIHVTECIKHLAVCDHMLVYLTGEPHYAFTNMLTTAIS